MQSLNNTRRSPKATTSATPTIKGNSVYQAAVKRFHPVPDLIAQNRPAKLPNVSSTAMVRHFLSAIAPSSPFESPVLSKDLERLKRVISSVLQAVQDDVLTKDEADAVINFMAERFAARRFDEIFAGVTIPKSGAWFVLHAHSHGDWLADTAPSSTSPNPASNEESEVPLDVSSNKAEADGASNVDRAIRKMAERAPETVMEMTAMMGPMMGHPLHQKVNENHITKMLDLALQHDTNEHDLRKNQQNFDFKQSNSDRTFHLIYFVLFIAVVVFILCTFRTQPTVLVPILTGVGGVVSGFMAGMGYAKATPGKRDKDN